MRLLLLAGTPEAVQIGQAIARDGRVVAIASVARASRSPEPMDLPIRIGGWGGDAAFADWLRKEDIDAVLDATHPFATRVSARTARICAEQGKPYVQFLRPAWVPGPHDNWTFLNDPSEANQYLPDHARVLITTGRRDLESYGDLGGRTVFVRVRELRGDDFPFANGRFLHRPRPLSNGAEVAALHSLGVHWILARNSGGAAGMAVIEAARQLGIPVGMIRRPPQPEVPRIRTVTEALAWVRRRL